MNNIKYFLLIFTVILIVSPKITLGEEIYGIESSFDFGNNEVFINNETGEVSLQSACDFNNPDSCDIKMEKQEVNGFWGNFKKVVSGFWNKIVNVFSDNKEQLEETSNQEEIFSGQSSDIFGLILNYSKDRRNSGNRDRNVEKKIQEKMENNINDIDNVGDLLDMKDFISFFCQQKYNGEGDFKDEDECKKDLMKKLRSAGDKIKEKLVADINENNTSYDTFKKLEKLRALLMAAESADEKIGSFFSEKNIKWAKEEIAKKALAWVINVSNTYISLEELQKFYNLVSAYSSAYIPGEIENGKYKGNSLFPGQDGLISLRYRIRRVLLQKMIGINICNPDPVKLKSLQDSLNKSPGCEKILGNVEACKRIMSGNLESAYKRLYDQDKGDESNNSDKNKVEKPIDCNRKQVTTTNLGSTNLDDVANVTYKYPDTIDQENSTVEDSDSSEEVVTENQDEDVEQVQDEIIEDEIVPEQEPEHIEDICIFNIHPEEMTGYNFTIDDCNKGYDDGLRCIVNCGWIPPLVMSEQENGLCNETISGFIDFENIIPCEPRPEPDPSSMQCISDCLRENI